MKSAIIYTIRLTVLAAMSMIALECHSQENANSYREDASEMLNCAGVYLAVSEYMYVASEKYELAEFTHKTANLLIAGAVVLLTLDKEPAPLTYAQIVSSSNKEKYIKPVFEKGYSAIDSELTKKCEELATAQNNLANMMTTK